MKESSLDLLEVVLKDDLKIPLSMNEKELLEQFDDEIKKSALAVIEEGSYFDETLKLINKIIDDASSLSNEEQKIIKIKCQNKIETMEKRFDSINYLSKNGRNI